MSIFTSFRKLTKFELALWLGSALAILISFLCGRESQPLTLIASLIGVTALIFVAKGDVLGQMLTVVFSLFYAVISWRFRYFGEMITYLGMTAPMAVLAAVAWWRHPYKEKEVAVATLSRAKFVWMLLLAAATTVGFYFILKYFRTANLVLSTVSITTSFLASYLTWCRSSYYALAYAANDVVLILLWVLAALQNPAYIPMIVCFAAFLANDLYGFVNWKRMQKRQGTGECFM